MLELLFVGVIVIVAAAYSTWALLPATTRRRVAGSIAAAMDTPRYPAWLRRAALGLQRRTNAGGGHCDDCGGAASTRRDEMRR